MIAALALAAALQTPLQTGRLEGVVTRNWGRAQYDCGWIATASTITFKTADGVEVDVFVPHCVRDEFLPVEGQRCTVEWKESGSWVGTRPGNIPKFQRLAESMECNAPTRDNPNATVRAKY